MRAHLRHRERPLAACVSAALAIGSSTPLLAGNATGVVPVGSGNGYLPQNRTTSMSVRNCNDGGVGSLREALQGDFGIIDLRSLPCTTISLTSGALPVAHDVQMLGPGAGRLFIDGMGHSRVFESTAKTSPLLATKDLTIRNGAATDSGGCIYTTGTLRIEDTNVYSCGVFSHAAGIFRSVLDARRFRLTSCAETRMDRINGGVVELQSHQIATALWLSSAASRVGQDETHCARDIGIKLLGSAILEIRFPETNIHFVYEFGRAKRQRVAAASTLTIRNSLQLIVELDEYRIRSSLF